MVISACITSELDTSEDDRRSSSCGRTGLLYTIVGDECSMMGMSNSDETEPDRRDVGVGVVLAPFLGGRSGLTGDPPSTSAIVLARIPAPTPAPSTFPWLPPSLAVAGGLGRFPSPFAKPPIPNPSGDSLTPPPAPPLLAPSSSPALLPPLCVLRLSSSRISSRSRSRWRSCEPVRIPCRPGLRSPTLAIEPLYLAEAPSEGETLARSEDERRWREGVLDEPEEEGGREPVAREERRERSGERGKVGLREEEERVRERGESGLGLGSERLGLSGE